MLLIQKAGRWIHQDEQFSPGSVLRFRPGLPRNERRPVHQIIEAKTNGMLGSDALPAFPLQIDLTERTASIVMRWTRNAERQASKTSKKRKRLDGKVHEKYPYPYTRCRQEDEKSASQRHPHLDRGHRMPPSGHWAGRDQRHASYHIPILQMPSTSIERLLTANQFMQPNDMELGNTKSTVSST